MRGPNKTRRPDLVVFINGLPLAIIELKNPADDRPTSGKPGGNSKPTRRRFPTFLTPTRPSSSAAGLPPALAPSPPTVSASCRGARSKTRTTSRSWNLKSRRSSAASSPARCSSTTSSTSSSSGRTATGS
ncbi:MAG: hypothetical protein LBG65_02280 [Puniceicoccales bacterium]|nr:hypothetical protein [Puniceicoccales bacterium]